MQQKNKHLSYHYYFFVTLFLALLGLLITSYLTYSHIRNYTDLSYSSFCAISKAINCDTVSQSPWSIIFNIPVAMWGLAGYILFLIILFFVRKSSPTKNVLWNLLFFLGLMYSLAAIFFGYISATKIHSYCILCLLSYAISFSLLLFSWFCTRRFVSQSFLRSVKDIYRQIALNKYLKSLLLCWILLLICARLFVPHYWMYNLHEINNDIHKGLTTDGHPWIGADNPKLTIEEYTDYQCFQCKKMHFFLRRLIAEHPDTIRLVHRHYPMDHEVNSLIVPQPFHIGSGKMALLAIYATSKNKFWQINDLLYNLGQSKKPFNIKTVADETGIPASEFAWALQAKEVRDILRYDILAGMKLKILGTPTFVINGKTYTGIIPPDILGKVLQ